MMLPAGVDVLLPRLSDSAEDATILRWLRAEGDRVAVGDEIVEIETDKATATYEAEAAGILRIVIMEGETAPVGSAIARLETAGAGADVRVDATEEPSAAAGAAVTAAESPAFTEPAAAEVATLLGIDLRTAAAPVRHPVQSRPTLRARRLAREDGVELAPDQGGRPDERTPSADVAAGLQSAARAAARGAAMESATGETTVVELTRTQQLIARRMTETKATVPSFTLSRTVDMTGCVELRARLKTTAGKGMLIPTYNDMIVRACGLALREFPLVNGSYKDGHFELHGRVNVGIAVATDDSLVVPTVFDADTKGLGQIMRDARVIIEAVRTNTVTPSQLAGGTFTISNLGMYGVTHFSAMINPPQAAILALGALQQSHAVRAGEVVTGHVMSMTLTCDHRILYGATAAQFLVRLSEIVQEPSWLLL